MVFVVKNFKIELLFHVNTHYHKILVADLGYQHHTQLYNIKMEPIDWIELQEHWQNSTSILDNSEHYKIILSKYQTEQYPSLSRSAISKEYYEWYIILVFKREIAQTVKIQKGIFPWYRRLKQMEQIIHEKKRALLLWY